MHIGLRTLFATLAVGLALVPSAFAYTGTETLVLARDACGGKNDNGDAVNGPDNPHLGWFTSGATSCGNLLSGLEPILGPNPDDFPSAADTGPVTLDGTRPIHIEISVSAEYPLKGGVGDSQIDLTLTGRSATNKTVTLGSGSNTQAAQDQLTHGAYTVKFDLPIPAGKDGVYKSLNLNLSAGGAELGDFVMEDGNSFVQLPIQSDTDAEPPETV